MTYTAATPYRSIGDTTLAAYESEFRRGGSPMLQDAAAIHAAAQPHSALFLAMAWHEQRYATTSKSIRPDQHNPVGLRPWDGDPNGMPPGATGRITVSNGGQYLVFDSFANCVREWKRRLFDDPAYKGGVYARTTTLQQMLDTYAPPGDVHEVTGIDNADSGYGADVLALLTRLEAAGLLPANVEASPMALKAHTVPGLGKPLWLPDDINVQIKLINNSNWGGQQRYTGQTLTTWHDTGPTGGNADSEWDWANNGRQGAGAAGYQAIIDDDEIIICHPFDRVTWHAGGDGKGNYQSYGAEQCREGVNRTKAIRNTAAFHGAVCAAKGWEVDTHLVQHHYWYGKNCPSYIRANGLWSSAVKQTTECAAAARAAAGGDGTGGAPTPVYATPALIPELDAVSKSEGFAPASVVASGTRWYWVGDRVRVTATATPRLQRAAKDAERVGPDLKKGDEFDVDWIAEYEGALWYCTPYGTRIDATAVQRVSDTKGEEAA